MTKDEMMKLQTVLQKRLNCETVKVTGRPAKDDSAEVYIGEEFVGVIFRDDEEGEVSYDFHMTILEFDLEEEA